MKRCVITGASSGIGRALAAAYVQANYEVIGVDLDEGGAEEVAQMLGGAFSFVQADLSEPESLAHVAELLEGPPIDVFIHSAGINAVGAFARSDIWEQRRVSSINLDAPLLLTAQLLRRGLFRRGSSLVFIASLSHFIGYPGAAVYAASKTGLAAYARSLSVALAPRGIHVLTVYPGPTRTPHAAKYSPDNRLESRRMLPEMLAAQVLHAVRAKRRVLVPGWSNKVMALAGRLAPGLAGSVMRRAILDKLPHSQVGDQTER